jgi:hypothetical protein
LESYQTQSTGSRMRQQYSDVMAEYWSSKTNCRIFKEPREPLGPACHEACIHRRRCECRSHDTPCDHDARL